MYNHVRPHRSLGDITTIEFAQDEVGEDGPGVDAGYWVGLRPPCGPALTYSTTLSS
jgi:hypothetical protein